VRAEYDIVAANSAAKKLRKAAADTQGEERGCGKSSWNKPSAPVSGRRDASGHGNLPMH
jgi:hypothetical protein